MYMDQTFRKKKVKPQSGSVRRQINYRLFYRKKISLQNIKRMNVRKKALTVTFNSDISFCLSLYFFG